MKRTKGRIVRNTNIQKSESLIFPSGPVVRTQLSHCHWVLRGVSFPKIRALTPQVPARAPPPWRSIPWPLSLHLLGGSNLESYVWALSDSPGSFSPWASVQLFPVLSPLCLKHLLEFCFPSRPRLMGREWEKCWALLPWVFTGSRESITSRTDHSPGPPGWTCSLLSSPSC